MDERTNYSFDTDSSTGRNESRGQCIMRHFRSNLLLIFLLLGIIAGVAIGAGVRTGYPDFSDSKRNAMYIGFPGELFLRMLKLCIIPMITMSLISGMAAIPGKAAGRMGGSAVVYYMVTTVMAVILGIILVTTIRPGDKGVDEDVREDKDKILEPIDSLLDLVRNCFPSNIIAACFEQTQTEYETEMRNKTWTDGNGTVTRWKEKEKITDFSVETGGGTNVLGLVVFSIVLGLVVGHMGEEGLPIRHLVDSLQTAILKIVTLVIWLSPIGIASILAQRIIKMKDPATDFQQLAWYVMTVLVGLGIHGFIVLPIIYLIFARKNPIRHVVNMSKALLTALGTASSSATLPITLQCLEDKAKVHTLVSRFVLPVGATINMDGTALYEAVASIFIAQINDIDLDIGQVITVCITATAAAIGAAGVPEAGLVTMVIVLTAVGLPTEDIGLILAVDWFLDRFRTMVNVWGDSVGAGVVERFNKDALEREDAKQREELKTPYALMDEKLTGVENGGYKRKSEDEESTQSHL